MKYKKRSDGYFEVKVTIGKTWDNRPIRKSFYSKKSRLDAKRKADEYKLRVQYELATGEIAPLDKRVSFSKWAMEWLETYKRGKVKESTYVNYKKCIERTLIPYFGDGDMRLIRQIDIQGYVNKRNCAGQTIKNEVMVLHSIFEGAVKNRLVEMNPAIDIQMPQIKRAEKHTYTMEQATAVSEYAINHGHGAIALLLETGMRKGELLALQWEDIDIENRLLHIRHGISSMENGYCITTPKTDTSERVVPLSKVAIRAIESIECKGSFVIGGKSFQQPSTFAKWYSRTMEIITRELGVPYLSIHELRHTYGTLLRDKGVDIYSIQKALGHSKLDITANVYVHNDIEVLKKAILDD